MTKMLQAIRRFSDLTDAEVLALSDDELARYVDLECAIEGVPLALTEPVRPEIVAPQPDVTLFGVGDLLFYDRQDADAVVALVNGCRRAELKWSGDYSKQIAQPADEVEVVAQKHFSAELWATVRSAVQEHAQAKKQYEQELETYRKVARERDAISGEMYGRIRDLRRQQYERETMQREFDRYIDLANGDRRMAAQFLDRAHREAARLLPEVAQLLEPEPREYVPDEVNEAEPVAAAAVEDSLDEF